MGRPSKGIRIEQRGGTGAYYILWPGNSRGTTTGTSNREQAEIALATFIIQRDQNDSIANNGLTVRMVLDIYLEEHVRPEKKVAGRVVKRKELAEFASDFLNAHFGDTLVADVVDDHIVGKDGYILKRERGELRRTDDAPQRFAGGSTSRRELGVLIAACKHCATVKDPVTGKKRMSLDDVPKIPLPPHGQARDRWLTYAEEAELRAAAPAADPPARLSRIHRFVTLALEDAARKEAIEELTWFQVDFEAGTVDYRKAGKPETNKKRAKVRMTRTSRAMLERAFQEKLKGSSYVLDHDGSIRSAFENAVERSGLRDVTPHVCRHTWATRASQNRVPMEEIAVQLADDIQTVTDNYWHHHPDSLQKAANWRDKETERKKETK